MELVLPVCSTPRMRQLIAWTVLPITRSLITLPKRLRLSLESAKGGGEVPQAIVAGEEEGGNLGEREQAMGSGGKLPK